MINEAAANGIDRLAPRIGEPSIEILGEAGHGAAEIEEFIAAGVTLDAAERRGVRGADTP